MFIEIVFFTQPKNKFTQLFFSFFDPLYKQPKILFLHHSMHTDLVVRARRYYANGHQRDAVDMTFETVSAFFGGSQQAAADYFGVSYSSMQRTCRKLGIHQWPYSRNANPDMNKRTSDLNRPNPSIWLPSCEKAEEVVCVFARVTNHNQPRKRKKIYLTFDNVSKMFGGTQKAAAQYFGISLSLMRRVCRRLGLRWPRIDPRTKKTRFVIVSRDEALALPWKNVDHASIAEQLDGEPPLDIHPVIDLPFISLDDTGYDSMSQL